MNIKKRLSINRKIASRIFLNDARRPGLPVAVRLPSLRRKSAPETALGECVAEHDQGTAMSGGYKLPRIFGVNMGRQSPVKKQGCGIYMSCQ